MGGAFNGEDRPLAVVVGGSSPIGGACVASLADAGYDVIITYYRNESGALRAQAAAQSLRADARVVQLDVRDEVATREVLRREMGRRRASALVYCAALRSSSAIHNTSMEKVGEVLDVGLSGFFLLSRLLVPGMARKGGSIVAIASVAATVAMAGQAPYCAAKAGLVAAARSLANEMGQFGVRVNAVSPGLIVTDEQSAPPGAPLSVLGRHGTPGDVAELVTFLCSARASFITGAAIPVSGGLG